jgi:hypothetical protein
VVFAIQSRTDFPPGFTIHGSWFRADPKLPSSEH